MVRAPLSGPEAVDVHLDAPELGLPIKVGRLFHRRSRGDSTLSFAYADEWLRSAHSFALDPRLDLYAGEQFAPATSSTFGIFLDSAPDRWGRVLLDRREAVKARSESRAVKTLTEWDYLLSVQDQCPAYDLNPNPGRREHALTLDASSNVPDLETVLASAEFYRLDAKRAGRLLTQIRTTVRTWKSYAKSMHLPASEIAAVARSFELSD